jgi:hypothetical protein
MWTTEDAPTSQEQLKDLNGLLLSKVYGLTPDPLTRQSVVTLVFVNNIDDDLRPNEVPLRTTEELIAQTSQWFEQNANRLPLLVKRPWELHLHTMITSQDQDARTAAFESMRNLRPFEAVDLILALLENPEDMDQGVRDRLAQLLGLIAGINYPPETEEDQSPVSAWRDLWFQKLREDVLTGAKLNEAINYLWSALERTLYAYNTDPNQAAADRIKEFRIALMHRLGRPQDIPATATDGARSLMLRPLSSKLAVAQGLAEFRARTQQRDVPLADVAAHLQQPYGRHIGVQFLQEIVNLAFIEEDEIIAFELGGLLRAITQVPVTLSVEDINERRDALTAWVEKVQERGYDVAMPEE